jgi:endonuclease III
LDEKRVMRLKSYSEELGLNLRRPEDRFKWFLASVLFAKRISSEIAKRTFRRFEEEGLVTPKAILDAGWDKLVQVLDSGGYVRYDFSTATNLLETSKALIERFGDLEHVHSSARSPRHLEKLLMEFRGVGPVGVNIFLRELRGIWDKADPKPSPLAIEVARRLGVKDIKRMESQLVRLNLEYCRKGSCPTCPLRVTCQGKKKRGPLKS